MFSTVVGGIVLIGIMYHIHETVENYVERNEKPVVINYGEEAR